MLEVSEYLPSDMGYVEIGYQVMGLKMGIFIEFILLFYSISVAICYLIFFHKFFFHVFETFNI